MCVQYTLRSMKVFLEVNVPWAAEPLDNNDPAFSGCLTRALEKRKNCPMCCLLNRENLSPAER